jgi:Family of unknown function (DUF5670)
MTNIFYVLAVILILLWAIGFFIFSLGAIIHILLALALVSVLQELLQEKNNKIEY